MKSAMNVSFGFDHNPDMNQQMGMVYYILRLKAPVNIDYANLLKGEGYLNDRLEDCLDELDVAVCDASSFPEACNLGWTTYSQEKHGEALDQMELLRDFFLREGCEGGEIVEMSEHEYVAFYTSDKTGLKYQRALDALYPSLEP
ncbi:hypothetical protein IFT48_02925 [Pseudomonas fluorescens]|uniref:hypothetical protein n=1 Tax=Pseudomonas fluorescens TaxID=294 RepID=UPI001930D6B7|nr:hypothetical protein [Pseudomonas fluorescens]MBD8088920.1 hypothetical protein [Pseudomonas fluorescens]